MAEIKMLAADILRFQVERNVKNTYKEALIVLEELRDEHEQALLRLQEALPKEYRSLIVVANYWTTVRSDSLRKRILTVGNNAARNINEQIDKLQISTI